MKNTLIIVGHTTYSKSVTTKTVMEHLLQKCEATSDNIKIRNLVQLYSDNIIKKTARTGSLIKCG